MDSGVIGPVPDGIEPLVGYRMWRLSTGPDGSGLHAMTCPGKLSIDGDCPWESSARGWRVSVCPVGGRRHSAPVEDCTCGFYAMKELGGLLREAPLWMADPCGHDSVMGRVELAGKVVEHERGYRAQRARIAELIPWGGTERNVARLAAEWGLPVGNAVALPTFGPVISPVTVHNMLRRILAKLDPNDPEAA